ncbi:MAG: ABC transporter ATP-binding protein [Dongiaceae bacterium]
MFLSLRKIAKRFGAVAALETIDLDIENGGFVCFLGPSGCGKTTLLRIIAGLETPDGGEILLNGKDLSRIPARLRNFGIVFQSYSLFPNMTVAKNVAYGLECRQWQRDAIDRRVRELLALVHLEDQTHKLPHQLSGGQQQRVALARALAPEPAVLLLDEPLSALDAKVREELRGEIRDLQAALGITTIMVTHDQDEAMEMADRIVVMNKGVIEQAGSAADLYDRPANRFVAEFIGRMNLVRLDSRLQGLAGFSAFRAQGSAPVVIGIRPEHIELANGDAAAIDVLQGIVERIVYLGRITRIRLDVDGQPLLVDLQGRPEGVRQGARLAVRIPAQAVHRFAEAAT